MNRLNPAVAVFVAAIGFACVGIAGCGSGDSSSTMTQAQQDQLRHPQKDPNYHGIDPGSSAKMAAALGNWKKQHENDKPQFANSPVKQ